MISITEHSTDNGFSTGWITLEQPKTLNALTLDMVHTAYEQLGRWLQRQDIACIVLQGDGRAFCAGGDVRRMRDGILAGDGYCEKFFELEYRLDYALHTYTKPVLAWGHGVVMGGGLGLLMGSSHRVVTNSTRLAMPETNIGLYPDVGASYFLNQLPQGLGLFLGISACEFNGADAVALGMAHHLLDDSGKDRLIALLAQQPWSDNATANHQVLTQALQTLPATSLTPQLTRFTEQIAIACQAPLAQAIPALQSLGIQETWYQHALATLDKGCPVTACIVAEQLVRGRRLTLAQAFQMEWGLSIQCTRHPDFPEGVRAQLVDKDKLPRWQHPSIAAVPHDYVMEHFSIADHANPLTDLGLGN